MLWYLLIFTLSLLFFAAVTFAFDLHDVSAYNYFLRTLSVLLLSRLQALLTVQFDVLFIGDELPGDVFSVE